MRARRRTHQSSLLNRPWYDYAGFLTCSALVFWNVWKSPTLTILLIPTLGFDTLAAVAFLVRDGRVARDERWWAQASAYGSGFLIPFAVASFGTWNPQLLARTADSDLLAAGLLLWAVGGVLKIWPLWHLRRAFAIEPAARRLVTTGPYKWARHPIYLAHTFVNVGILLQVWSAPLAAVVAGWFALTLVRMRAEDAVLADAFNAEHSEYRRRIAAFLPRFWAFG